MTVQNMQHEEKNKLHILESIQIRRELFKYYYPNSNFELNQKADAFEAFDTILTLTHEWIANGGDCKDCFVHNLFCLKRV